jgi:hypothetical protein
MPRKTVLVLIVLGAFSSASGCKSPSDPEVIVPTLPAVPESTVLLLDDTDLENGGVGVLNWTNFRHWDVLAGCVDLHGNGFYDVQAGNGLYIDLDGTCTDAGTIQSKATFALQPGMYTLEFWLAGNQRISRPDTVNVSLGSLYTEQIVLQQTEPFRLFTRRITVAAATEAKLRFQNLGGDNQGALLDLVRLRRGE